MIRAYYCGVCHLWTREKSCLCGRTLTTLVKDEKSLEALNSPTHPMLTQAAAGTPAPKENDPEYQARVQKRIIEGR